MSERLFSEIYALTYKSCRQKGMSPIESINYAHELRTKLLAQMILSSIKQNGFGKTMKAIFFQGKAK